jgi:hypothetical protein
MRRRAVLVRVLAARSRPVTQPSGGSRRQNARALLGFSPVVRFADPTAAGNRTVVRFCWCVASHRNKTGVIVAGEAVAALRELYCKNDFRPVRKLQRALLGGLVPVNHHDLPTQRPHH